MIASSKDSKPNILHVDDREELWQPKLKCKVSPLVVHTKTGIGTSKATWNLKGYPLHISNTSTYSQVREVVFFQSISHMG